MQTNREKITYSLPYSLADAHISTMNLVRDRLRLQFKDGFKKGDSKVEGQIFFEGVDLEASELTTYKIKEDNKIKGKRHDLEKFISKHDEVDFEIVEELYGPYQSLLKGYFHKEDKVKEFVLSIVHTGNMIYDTTGEDVAVNKKKENTETLTMEDVQQAVETGVTTGEWLTGMPTPTGAEAFLIKNTTKEQRLKIVKESLGMDVDCEGFDGGLAEMYDAYVNGEKELAQINGEFRGNYFEKDDPVKR